MITDNLLDQVQRAIEDETRDVHQSIRSEVNAVIGSIFVIKQLLRQENPAVAKHIDDIEKKVENILHASKKWEDALTIPQNFDIEQSLRSITEYFNEKFSSDITITFDDSKGKLTTVYGIERKISKAIVNIIQNAVQAISGQGTISIELRTVNDEPGNKCVEINISDTGWGIPACKRDFVFELGTSYWPDGKGGGFGLWFARNIIRSANGDIRIKNSEVGKGTTFAIVLPVVEPKLKDETIDSLDKQPQFDVFLAHNSGDKPHVEAIAEKLKQQDLKPWIDKEQIPPGRWFQDVIQQAISDVKSAAIFLGPSGLGKWQIVELRAFISRCVEANIPVIPVLLPGVDEIPEDLLFLKELNWVSFKSIDDFEALDNLVWGITGEQPKRP